MCSHGKYFMMKVIDGYKLKLMNSAETVHQNSLAYYLVLRLYPLILSVHAVMNSRCAQHIWKTAAGIYVHSH